jgi:hypothetical protein
MNQPMEVLAAVRINGIMQGLQDPRLLPQELVWNKRIPDVPAADEEIMARFIGTPLIADLIADDAKAAVYAHGKFQFETNKVPNLKFGIGVNQSTLAQIDRIRQGYAGPQDQAFFSAWENRIINDLILGIERRKEMLKIAMVTDQLNYDRLGVKAQNVTWGMPSDLKVTVSIAWSSTSATPLTDILTVMRTARIRYGVVYNRVSMSTAAFQNMVKTTEFLNQAKLWGYGMFSGIPGPAIPLQSDGMLQTLAQRMLGQDANGPGVTLEMYDARYWSQDTAGLTTSSPFLPLNLVILSQSGFDGSGEVMDFANGNTIEGMVAGMTQVPAIGRIPQGPGPIAYATLTSPDLNSPGLTYWGVARGFPRKRMLQATAVLDVGTTTDTITVGVPFPA